MTGAVDPPRSGAMMATMEREATQDRLGREAFVSLVLAANQFGEQIEQVCQRDGISHAQYTVLWVLCLADAPGGLPMGAIADGLLTRAADVTRLVDRLVSAGHLQRSASDTDRRVVLVEPTASGRAVFDRVTEQVKALHRQQFAGFSIAELRELTRLLNRTRLSASAVDLAT